MQALGRQRRGQAPPQVVDVGIASGKGQLSGVTYTHTLCTRVPVYIHIPEKGGEESQPPNNVYVQMILNGSVQKVHSRALHDILVSANCQEMP